MLYVIVDQDIIDTNKIEIGASKTTTLQNDGSAVSRPISNINISQIVPFVNNKDLLRYLPDDMLSDEQKQIKWEAIAETIKYTNSIVVDIIA